MAEEEQKFEVQKIFIKDVSFESPHSPEIFREQWQPGWCQDTGNGQG